MIFLCIFTKTGDPSIDLVSSSQSLNVSLCRSTTQQLLQMLSVNIFALSLGDVLIAFMHSCGIHAFTDLNNRSNPISFQRFYYFFHFWLQWKNCCSTTNNHNNTSTIICPSFEPMSKLLYEKNISPMTTIPFSTSRWSMKFPPDYWRYCTYIKNSEIGRKNLA